MTDGESPELLEAALSMLEHYEPLEDEVGLLALVDLDADEAAVLDRQVASSAVEEEEPKRSRSRKKADGFHPNRSREKRKEEIVYLRAKVHDMEVQLTQLQQNETTDSLHIQRLAVQPPAIATGEVSSGSSVSASMWEQIAVRQSSERRKAELENVRLKFILEGQIKVAKGLEKLLSKRNNPELSVETGYPLKRLCRQIAPVNNDASIFEMLSQSAASAIGDVDAVFAANGLSKTERDLQDSRVCKNTGKGMFMEVFASKMMPFPLHAAADVVWEHYTRSNKNVPTRSYSPKLMNKSDDDAIFEQFDVQMHGKRSAAGFHVHKVSRRFIQEDRERVVIVWRSVVDQIQFTSDTSLNGLRFQEHSYVVIKKPTTMPSESYSLVQTCFIMVPEVDDSGESGPLSNGVGRITDFLLNSFARYTQWSHQMIENCLLEQCLTPKQSH